MSVVCFLKLSNITTEHGFKILHMYSRCCGLVKQDEVKHAASTERGREGRKKRDRYIYIERERGREGGRERRSKRERERYSGRE